jgi:uncharacterized iron-regulated membrane protein
VNVRKLLLKLHLFGGFAGAVFIVILGLTGGIMAFAIT